MSFINISVPSYPFFIHAGNAAYRPGDKHQSRRGLNFFDLLLVESGTLFMNADGKEYALSANDILIIPPLVPHFGSKICTEKTFFHWMHFNTKEFFELSGTPRPAADTVQDGSLILSLPLCQSLTEEAARSVISVMEHLETSLINYFTNSNTRRKPQSNPCHQQELFLHLLGTISVKQNLTGVNEIAYAAMQYLTTHYMDTLNLDHLAQMMNCHPTHLIRCFKKQYGASPIQMLIRIRLNRACGLLMDPDLSITAIAYSVGFSSASYFCKQFKARFQCSPKEYRSHLSDKHVPVE